MDYLSDKAHSMTGVALSNINKLRGKRKQQPGTDSGQADTDQNDANERIPSQMQPSAIHSQRRQYNAPLSSGTPFGGDTSDTSAYGYLHGHRPPPIGFNVVAVQPGGQGDSNAKSTGTQQPNLPMPVDKQHPVPATIPDRAESNESLYSGDAWSRLWFQRVMILSFIRLILFIRKVYEDYHATKIYNITGKTGYFLISAATLFLPTIVFTIYRVARYLQVTLPPLREAIAIESGTTAGDDNQGKARLAKPASGDDDDKQLRRALMGSPTSMGTGNLSREQTTGDEDGLVTARQSPSNLEDVYVDSKSKATSSRQTPVEGQKNESVDVDKLGNISDKQTTRVVIGASEQLLHGALFIFWQLKRQVDVMGYLVERACLWRKPKQSEQEQLSKLRLGSDGLEWFQDFYAAFLAILAQVYTLGLHWASNESPIEPLRSATTGNSAAGSLLDASDGLGGLTISETARSISQTLAQQTALGNTLAGKDLIFTSQLFVSSAVVLSLLIAVKRRDDGPLTLGLSMLGWGSIFAARIIIIALAFVHIGWHIMLSLVVLHILGITGWIYKIALDSHNGKPDENEALKWEVNNDNSRDATDVEAGQIELDPKVAETTNANEATAAEKQPFTYSVTNKWSIAEHLVLIAQVMSLFALPSLFYWPIMFNLKLHYRPFKYLVLILSENFILIPVIWFKISSTATIGQWYLLGVVGGFSIVGFIFISLYVSCKPSLTEYFARADELFNEADQAGIYFEFCSRVFKMPDLSKHEFRRLLNQTEAIEEYEE